MSVIRPDDELLDDDPTDELPVLSETAVLSVEEGIPELVEAIDEGTGEHDTAAWHFPGTELAAADRERNAAANAKIAELEADIARLGARWSGVERHLAEKDAEIGELRAALASRARLLEELAAAAERLRQELADRDGELRAANEALERERAERGADRDDLAFLRSQHAELRAEIATVRGEAEAARAAAAASEADAAAARERQATVEAELARARAELEARPRGPVDAETLKALREENAALAAYIENRRARWEGAEALAAARLARIAELERELEQRAARQRAAEERARDEIERAAALRDELAELGRRLESAEREIRGLRGFETGAHDEAGALRLELASERAGRTAQEQETARLREALAAAERELADARAALERAAADAERERAAASEKDRQIATLGERLGRLEQEIERRVAALQRLNALDVSLQDLDSRMSERLSHGDAAAPAASSPALVCLAGEQPQRYALAKPVMIIGRGAQCDIQVVTQFVSREHARLTVQPDCVVIEDLGSKNGVFVNAVRVDRYELRHSDIVTVGETQFRFLEAAPH